MLRRWLAHPLTRGLSEDDPSTTERRRSIIQGNTFLKCIYQEWYRIIAASLPSGPGPILELGSGAGFFQEFLPDLITSEVFCLPHIRVVLNGEQLPMADRSLRGLVMTDVFHHVANPRRFLNEARRCVQDQGVVCMIEPWVTPWSSFIYSRLHHEPFSPQAKEWGFPPGGPLSSANGAQPWIVFVRDRPQFEKEFPEWKIVRIEPLMPFRYLLSGGVSMRQLTPRWSFGFFKRAEGLLNPWMKTWAMFALIVLRRTNG